MIINFTVKNFMSFKDETTVSFVASNLRKHNARVAKSRKYGLRILPIAAFFGANGSGKSNLIKALEFVKNIIISSSIVESKFSIDGIPFYEIKIKPFALDKTTISEPSYFKIEFLMQNEEQEKLYEFSISLHSYEILEEKLVEINKNNNDKILYYRTVDNIILGKSLYKNDEEHQSLKLIFKCCRKQDLFFTKTLSYNFNIFQPIKDWFLQNLQIISTNTLIHHGVFFSENNKHDEILIKLNKCLKRFDTNIEKIQLQKFDPDNDLIRFALNLHEKGILRGNSNIIIQNPENILDRIFIIYKNNAMTFNRLVNYHKGVNGELIAFDITQEPAGILRLIDLLPLLFNLKRTDLQQCNVLIIDDLDKNLHTILISEILGDYLLTCDVNTRTQLIFTTHDNTLLGTQLMRYDEEYLLDNDDQGISAISSIYDFKHISGTVKPFQVRKEYILRKLGGVPKIEDGCFD